MQEKWSESEIVLREGLEALEKSTAEGWRRYDAMSLLGGSLLGERKFADGEALVISGYQGLKVNEAKIPAESKYRVTAAAVRVLQLYEAWQKPDKAREWKRELKLTDLPTDVFASKL